MTLHSPAGPSKSAAVFAGLLRQWYTECDPPDVVSIRVQDDVPTVTYRTADDDDVGTAVSETWQFTGAAVQAFDTVDYQVERADFLALPRNREDHPGGLRWHVEAEWARAYNDDEIGHEELLERVDATMQVIEDLNE